MNANHVIVCPERSWNEERIKNQLPPLQLAEEKLKEEFMENLDEDLAEGNKQE